jgi:drug/metabolite transporter (DMT)-like permease
MSVVVRRMATGAVPLPVIVFIVTGTALFTLGPLSLDRVGLTKMIETPLADLGVMLAAGVFNLLAFAALTYGLRLIHVIYANVINTSQVALCALAGVLLFSEPFNTPLACGVGLTITGTLLISIPRK